VRGCRPGDIGDRRVAADQRCSLEPDLIDNSQYEDACSLNPFFRTRLDVRDLHILRSHKLTVLELSLDMYRPEDGRDRLVHARDLQKPPTRSNRSKPVRDVT